MPTRDRLDFLSEGWSELRPEMDISPWQIWGRTTRLHELFVSQISRVLRRHSLTFTEFQTLGALVLAGPPYRANPTQIQRFNLLTSGGLANLLGRMESEGLIERNPDPDDRRGVVVHLTAQGLNRFNAALVEENQVEHELLGAMNPEERAVLSILLRKLLASIDPEGTAVPDRDEPRGGRSAAAGPKRRPAKAKGGRRAGPR
jgi:DNA-binding MarR family transcriptional regulator